MTGPGPAPSGDAAVTFAINVDEELPLSILPVEGGSAGRPERAGSGSSRPPAGSITSSVPLSSPDAIFDRDQVPAGQIGGRGRSFAHLVELVCKLPVGRLDLLQPRRYVAQLAAQPITLVFQGGKLLHSVGAVPLCRREQPLDICHLCLDVPDALLGFRFGPLGLTHSVAPFATLPIRISLDAGDSRDLLLLLTQLRTQPHRFRRRCAGASLQLLYAGPQRGLRLTPFSLDLVVLGARLRQTGIELRVLPAHRNQLLIDLLRTRGRLLRLLCQLVEARRRLLPGCLQLIAFGAQGVDLGAQLLVLLLHCREFPLELAARGDRFRGPGQLVEPLARRRQRLV